MAILTKMPTPFLDMLGQLVSHTQKNEVGLPLIIIYKNYVKSINNLNIGAKTGKLFEEIKG